MIFIPKNILGINRALFNIMTLMTKGYCVVQYIHGNIIYRELFDRIQEILQPLNFTKDLSSGVKCRVYEIQ